MCGIAGVFNTSGVDPSAVSAMARAMAHRGPDAHTTRRYGGRQPYAAIGIERLAIVDPKMGGQPATDPSGRWRVLLNGEIYNHSRIAKELAADGILLKTGSDTELLAALIARTGLERALERCHGMFAITALDTVERRLFLVRDRMGVKPLHWAQLDDGTVLWSSEIKGLRQHPALRLSLDPVAIQQYLLFEYIPTPRTIWREVQKVAPGTWICADAQGVHHHRWWTPPVTAGGSGGNFERWARSVRGALQVAVHQRMEADVPVGYLLSGGLDSGCVAALAAAHSNTPIHTFSVAVEGTGFDEAGAARQTAQAIGSVHHETRFGPGDLTHTLRKIIGMLDEPLADSSLLPTWELMALVQASGFKCVQSGDGADESFAGYPTHLAHQVAGIASPAQSLLRRIAGALPTTENGVSTDYMARRFVDGLGTPWQRRHQIWMGAWLPAELQPDDSVWREVDAHAAAVAQADAVSRALYLDQRMYLGDGVLTKVDRAAGAHGVEVRSAFMDHAIVELAAQIGIRHNLRGFANKRVLRAAVADLLPEATRNRKKKGFGAPVGPWLRGPCTYLLDGLDERLADWIPGARLQTCISEHRAGIADHRRRLWSALVLAEWMDGPWS
jgi:asparagine synthase (glutamine-hydrolysing)